MTYLSASHHDYNNHSATISSRREWTRNICTSVLVTTSAAVAFQRPAIADDTIFKTGKAPIVPGQKPKDKGDTKGTRKDPSFLRSISDCKVKCEQSPGPDGLAR